MTSRAQAAVERMIAEGVPFDEIERQIDTMELPSEHLGALWLLAWAEATDPFTRRRVVAEVLAGEGQSPAFRNRAASSSPGRDSNGS